MKKPIAIFGFGRSGTTWISDIISKSLGGIILFEPFHPAVWVESYDQCYLSELDNKKHQDQLKKINNKEISNPWLLRNHLGVNPQSFSNSFVNTIWDNTTLIGFKSIRANFCIPQFKDSHNSIYVIRHPLAVLSSIINRPQFFEEYGWENHVDIFLSRANAHPVFKDKNVDIDFSKFSKEEIILIMWTMSNLAGIHDCINHNIPIVYYEDLYTDPFVVSKSILSTLGYPTQDIHPSYLFTPSMLTLKTMHSFYDKEINQDALRFFWEKHISNQDEKKYLSFISSISNQFVSEHKKIERYLP